MLTTRMPLPATGSNSLVAASGYCFGFVIVVLERQQLFTESTLTVILPVLTRRDARTLFAALRLWAVVLLANLAGTWIFASILVLPTPFIVQLAPALQTLAQSTLESNCGTRMLKATLAGWLIGLTVWLLPNARSAAVVIIGIVTYVVSICELSHVIAGSGEAADMVLRGEGHVADYLGRFLAPTLVGNVLSGVALVGLLNHASIVPEMTGRGGE